MEERERQLLDALKNRPDKDPDIEFSKQVRQKLQKTHVTKGKRFSVVTILTIPVTIAIIAFLAMIVTGQPLELKSAAQLTNSEGGNLSRIVFFGLLLTLLMFIVLVYTKGYTKGRLVYMTFSLTFAAWVGNLVYAESFRLEEPLVLPTYRASFNYTNNQLLFMYVTNKESEEVIQSLTIGPYTIEGDEPMWNGEEIHPELRYYAVRLALFNLDKEIVQYVKEHEDALEEATLTFQTSSGNLEVVAPIEKLTGMEPSEERMLLEQKASLRTHNLSKLDEVLVYKAWHNATITDILYPDHLEQQIDIKLMRLPDMTQSTLNALEAQRFEDYPEAALVPNVLPFTVSKEEKFALTYVSKTPAYNKKVYDVLLTLRSDRGENYEMVRMLPTLTEQDIVQLKEEE
ncbi:hypothetical protein AEA09_15070 [Lysinibacillus contaminans]|uniref:Uncharacterized protein n=1 Tax=Lysinibacillus contaminans TaxID=1293441 RepID=A0ABR5JYE4_9BACI|nr:hypothetical protein [Lysinibacillus contaminans]KOS67168.1 hypothetical protein AEA09_15070 [Lysinibacillus contaminans]